MGGKIYLVIGTITFILLIIFAIGLILFILDRRDKRGKEEKINKKESMIGEKAYPPTEPKKKNGIPSIVKVLCGFIGIILVAAITATFFREDNNMGLAEIFIIIGLVGIVAFIIMRIVVFSRKQYLKLANIGLVVCLAVFIGSIIIFAVGEDKRRSDFANDAFFENFTIKLTPSDDVQRTPKATDAVSTPTRDTIPTQTVEPTASGTPTPEPTRTINIDNSSIAQINALKSAESYLDIMSFSYEGLIEQLEYEGFTHEQAVYGAKSVGLDE